MLKSLFMLLMPVYSLLIFLIILTNNLQKPIKRSATKTTISVINLDLLNF